ncbi:6040_t:CDS:1 [Acaulospora colombiana]|uniref:6040_t:CDS:1 n=1 Tax=Acaulospora colombiana TaxID=27376 RepID=A0ACA9P6M9_9GLOM|nr:6040_t:CDS:1 [Acaulospora colombiana]
MHLAEPQNSWTHIGLTAIRQNFSTYQHEEGRHLNFRRRLGLPERRLSSKIPPVLQQNTSSSDQPVTSASGVVSNKRNLLFKRALELVFYEPAQVPNLDHAQRVMRLKLTEDSCWDYSSSRRDILAAFDIVAQRDLEESAAAVLAKQIKTKSRLRTRRRKQVTNKNLMAG